MLRLNCTLRRSLVRLLLCFGMAVMPGLAVSADGPDAVLLLIDKAGSGATMRLDLAALKRLPQHSFTTRTPWAKEAQKFTGPLLRDVVALAQGKGTVLKAVALNEYQITIPLQDARQHDMVVAHLINDKPIPVRERGPFFVIYPFDQKPELQTARYYERSIWQLKSLVIE